MSGLLRGLVCERACRRGAEGEARSAVLYWGSLTVPRAEAASTRDRGVPGDGAWHWDVRAPNTVSTPPTGGARALSFGASHPAPGPWVELGSTQCGVLCCDVLRCVVCGGGARPPAYRGVLRWCVAPHLVRRAALGCCVLCCVALCVVVLCGPPFGGACCVGVWPPSWWGVLCWCVAPLIVGRAALGGVCCVVWSPIWRGVLRWCVAPLIVGRVVVVCGPPHGGAELRCVVLCPLALLCGVLCCVALCCVWWCVAPRMAGRGALVCGPPHGGACCSGVRCVVLFGIVCSGGVWPPVWWGLLRLCVPPSWCGVLWWCVAPLIVGLCCIVLCCVALRCGVLCCVLLRCVVFVGGVWPPSWWGVLRSCVAPLIVGCAALGCGVVCGPPFSGAFCVCF